MTVVSKASAFPKSVQPGIPALGPKPMGWLRGPLSAHLFEQQRPIRMSDDAEYRLVTVKRSRGGVVTREHLRGREISVKSQFLLHPGDFLISKRQIVHGACGIVPEELEGSIASNEYAILRGKPTVDLEFLNYLAHSIYFQQTCFHSSIGVHVEKMIFKLDRWLSWDFDLPPLPEQRKIAEVLSTWDAAISAQERLIANAKHQKKALMQTLLPTGTQPPKKRLPGFTGDWARKHFRDAVLVDRNSLGQNTPADFRFRYISLSDVERGTIGSDLSELEFASAPSRARRKLTTGDILMATVRPNLQAFARVGSIHADCIASTGFAVLTAKPGFDPSYIYHYLFSEHLTGQIDALVVGSSYPAINSSDIKGLSMHCSSADEQAAIAQVLNAADALITDHENQLAVFCQEKSALMQQLLTGKRRVKVKEAA